MTTQEAEQIAFEFVKEQGAKEQLKDFSFIGFIADLATLLQKHAK